jgi:hypothetical protein
MNVQFYQIYVIVRYLLIVLNINNLTIADLQLTVSN